jgi:8-oxo-dGTP pyrophosphatase MutT (NUDIX family)
MQTKTDISYGVVPLYKDADEWKVLLIHQISHKGGKHRFWILPKGHAEGKEEPLAAAARELAEETGITNITFKGEQSFTVQYSFTHEGERIDKTVQYFVGICDSTHTELTQPEEILEMKWCSFAEAKALVTHKNTKDILEQVEQTL